MSTTDLTIHPAEDESETRRLFEIKQRFTRYKPPDRLNPTIYRLFIQQKFSQCKQKIKEILDDTPEMLCEYPLLLRGQIAREEGEICESVEWISKALKDNHRSPKVLFEMGKSHYLLGEHQRAIELFKLALEAQQKRNEEKGRGLLDWRLFYWQSLAVYHVYKSPERVKKSQDVMLACPKINSSADMLMFLAKILDEQNETGAAVEAYKRSIEMEPENVDLIHSLGMLYLKMEDQSNAFTTFGKALSYDANYVPSVLAIASILQMNNDWDVALSKYKIVAADFDHSCAIWNNIGMCFFGKSKLIAALSCLHRANYLCPLDWKVLINMALVYCALRQFASAYHFAAAAYAVNSNNASILCVMSLILTELQDFRNAYAVYKKAIKLEPKLWIARYNLAIFESRRSNYKEAVSILRELENEGLNYGENKNRLNSEELNQLIEKVRKRFEGIAAIEGSAVPEIKE